MFRVSSKDLVLEGNLYKQFSVITAKTNSGKTTLAVKGLRKALEEKCGKFDRFIVLTPYSATKRQTLNDERFRNNIVPLNYTDLIKTSFGEKVLSIRETIFTTYAALSCYLEEHSLDPTNTCLVFDELPRFAMFSTWQKQHASLIGWMLENWERFVAVGMTGTPELLFSYFNRQDDICPFKFVDITPHAPMTLEANKGLFIQNGSITSYARKLIKDGFDDCKMFFVESPKEAYKLVKEFAANNIEAAYTCSIYNEDICIDTNKTYAEMMLEDFIYDDMSIYDWIVDRSDIPPQVQVLIINGASADGINILDKSNRVKEVVVQSVCKMTIEQVRARIRHDIEQLTVIYNEANKQRCLNSFDDAASFYNKLNNASNEFESYSVLMEQYIRQQDKEESYKKWVDNNRCGIKPEQPDYIVCKYNSRLFVNPFIVGIVQYELDNYIHSRTKTYIEGNDEMTETVLYWRGNMLLESMDQFIASLKVLTGDKAWKRMFGSQIVCEINNRSKADTQTFIEVLGFASPQDTVVFTPSELTAIAKQLDYRMTCRNKAGKTTLLKWLDQAGFEVVKTRDNTKKNRPTIYKIHLASA